MRVNQLFVDAGPTGVALGYAPDVNCVHLVPEGVVTVVGTARATWTATSPLTERLRLGSLTDVNGTPYHHEDAIGPSPLQVTIGPLELRSDENTLVFFGLPNEAGVWFAHDQTGVLQLDLSYLGASLALSPLTCTIGSP